MTRSYPTKRGLLKFASVVTLSAALLSAVAPVSAKTVEFDQATIADLQGAMAAGTLDRREAHGAQCLARIQAFDRQGPKLHAVISLNPKAMEEAKALDAERKAGKVRGPLHGIPVVLKDNYDTVKCPPPAVRCCWKARSRPRTPSW
jgi:amidase